ncbi:uncharacterized protein LY79DRAFT_542962, partial [Colletotrichum navitas]
MESTPVLWVVIFIAAAPSPLSPHLSFVFPSTHVVSRELSRWVCEESSAMGACGPVYRAILVSNPSCLRPSRPRPPGSCLPTCRPAWPFC